MKLSNRWQAEGARRQILVLVEICKYHFNLPQTPQRNGNSSGKLLARTVHTKGTWISFGKYNRIYSNNTKKQNEERKGIVTALCYSINCYVQVLLSGLVLGSGATPPFATPTREMTNVNSDKCHNAKAKQKQGKREAKQQIKENNVVSA